MEWLIFDYTILLKFVGVSAILTLLYYILFARTASYLQCRLCLLSIIVIAALISTTQMRVYPAEVTTIEIVEENSPIEYFEPTTPTTVTAEVDKAPLNKTDILLIIYVIVTALLLIKYLYHLYKIIDLSRWGTITKEGNIRLVRNNRVSSPFSYFKNIYINRKLEGETLHVVLQHERYHIEHRHYIDALVIELFSILLWFNPFVWLVRRELRDIHEFQVDSAILENGLEVSKYQSIIFAELMGYSPNIANGFHNSLIKKRFIMMMNKRTIKLKRLRKLIIAPIILLLLILFSFTSKEDIVKYSVIPSSTQIDSTARHTVTEPIKKSIDSSKIVNHNIKEVIKYKRIDSLDYKPLSEPDLVSPIDDQISSLEITEEETDFNYTLLTNEQMPLVDNVRGGGSKLISVTRDGDETLVTFAMIARYDTQWVQFSSGWVIRDRKTHQKYYIKRVERGIQLDSINFAIGKKFKHILFTMVFPALPEKTEKIDIMEVPHPNDIRNPRNDEKICWYNINVRKFQPDNDNTISNGRYTHPADRLVTEISSADKPKMRLIIDNQTTTRLEITLNKDQLYTIPKTYAIRDVVSGRLFKAKRVSGCKFDTTTLGKKGDKITVIFGNLTYGVDKIDIGTFAQEGEKKHEWSYKNLEINN